MPTRSASSSCSAGAQPSSWSCGSASGIPRLPAARRRGDHGRRSHSQILHLWANGDYVGRWTVKANGNSELEYDAAWCSSELGRAISLSLPSLWVMSIQRRHFNSTAKEVGYGATAEPLLRDFIARTPTVVNKVRSELPAGFSEKVADKIPGGLLAAAQALERMVPS